MRQADRISRLQINIALEGYVLEENNRLETHFVLCNIKVGHAAIPLYGILVALKALRDLHWSVRWQAIL